MRPVHRSLVSTIAVLAMSLVLVAGCGGGGDDDGSSNGADTGGAGSLVHVDGTIKANDDGFVITPKGGGEPRTFTEGPAVKRAEVMALSASGEPARVTYRDGEQDVAAAVGPAPKLGEGVEAVDGLIVSVDDSTLVIKGDDGERTFDISGADPAAFDVEHLQDHASEATPIRVYFRADAPEAGIAYEDA